MIKRSLPCSQSKATNASPGVDDEWVSPRSTLMATGALAIHTSKGAFILHP